VSRVELRYMRILKQIGLTDVGPGPRLSFDVAERINIITGDNGLGKTFLLDIAWWGATGSWADRPAEPNDGHRSDARLHVEIRGTNDENSSEYKFGGARRGWVRTQNGLRPKPPALVIYARSDGRYSLWDPERDYWSRADITSVVESVDEEELSTEQPAFGSGGASRGLHLTLDEVWNGKRNQGKFVTRGLIEDWVTWQDRKNEQWDALCAVLKALSPHPTDPIVPGRPRRSTTDDDESREFPSLALPYGEVSIMNASAGMRRIVALAYLLVWSWQEHQVRSDGRPVKDIVLLVDEPETHLHPQWQRRILPSIIESVSTFHRGDGANEESVEIQLLATTHSPLVLGSLEQIFDVDRDALCNLELVGAAGNRHAQISELEWYRLGSIEAWLGSPAIGLDGEVRPENADLKREAFEVMSGNVALQLHELDELSARLIDSLSSLDPYVIAWHAWRSERA